MEVQVTNPTIGVMSEKKTPDETAIPTTPDLSTGEVEGQGYNHAATKKLLRKLDWHIIPFMSLIYLLFVHHDFLPSYRHLTIQ